MSLSIDAVAEALVAWVRAEVPEIDSTYKAAVGTKTQPLPDVAVEVQETEILREDAENFPRSTIEQVWLRTYSMNLMLVVDPDPPEVAAAALTSYVDALVEAALQDPTLGGRVPQVAMTIRASFNPPFVEFDDRTRGRQATLELVVGEFLNTEDYL